MSFKRLILKILGLSLFISNPVHAGISTFYQQIQNDWYSLVGYPTTTAYQNLTASTGPPKLGYLGYLKSIVNGAISLIQGSGVTSCDAIPSSGSFSGVPTGFTSTISGTYASPQRTIPTGLKGAGGAFQKRINLTYTDATLGEIKVGFEWVCDQDESYTEMSLKATNDSWSGSATRVINVYSDYTDATSQRVEVMMVVSQSGTTYDSQIYRFLRNYQSGTFMISGINVFFRGTTPSTATYKGYRLGMTGNINSASNVSTYLNMNTFSTSISSVTGSTADYTTEGPISHRFSQTMSWTPVVMQGCLNFSTQSDPASSGLCSGITFTNPYTPSVDANGSFNYSWVAGTLPSKVSIGF